jgi:triacylglycerol lipase
MNSISKIQVPNTLSFNSDLAMELANLIWLANIQYDYSQKDAKDIHHWPPQETGKLVGSTKLDFEPSTGQSSGSVEYDLLSVLWFTEVSFLKTETVPFGFIVRRDIGVKTGIFIVFRGTREKAEWISNFQAEQALFLGESDLGKVSFGFHKILTRSYDDLDESVKLLNQNKDAVLQQLQKQSIEKTILDTLNNNSLCPPNSEVYITGHSLGGALATLATLLIAKRTNFTNPVLYSFAAPRAGDKNFAGQFNELECYRIANSEDLVPTVPPATNTLIGAEMQHVLSIAQKNRIEALNELKGFFSGNLLRQDYAHVGIPLYFTDHRGSISYNHNLESTYRQALP